MNRRKMLSMFGLAGGATLAPVAALAVGVFEERLPPTDGTTGITLMGMKEVPPTIYSEIPISGSYPAFTIHHLPQPTGHNVILKVGEDGHLWLKINDKWKRITTT